MLGFTLDTESLPLLQGGKSAVRVLHWVGMWSDVPSRLSSFRMYPVQLCLSSVMAIGRAFPWPVVVSSFNAMTVITP